MDTKRGEMSEYHSQSEDEATISSILGTVFPVEKEEETTATICSDRSNEEGITMFSERANEEGIAISSAKPDEEGITMISAKLDEEAFEPLVEQGELPSIPTEEELVKYPELEYSSREVQAIVNKMDRVQKQEFREYEQYFLTRYRQTGNMQPLYMEVRNIVKEMCPSMPGQMQNAVVEARAQLLAENQPSTSKAVRKIVPTLVTTEVKKEVKPQVQLGLLSDTILDAMGPGDEECMVT